MSSGLTSITVDDPGVYVDPESGAEVTSLDNGDVEVELEPQQNQEVDQAFNANLAITFHEDALNNLATTLLEGIDADIQSRSEWVDNRAEGIKLLGLKLEQSKGGDANTSAPLEGMSVVRHPLLQEAVLRFQANAVGELLPADGPVKIKDDGFQTGQSMNQAERLEKEFNHYLTSVATEYYPDTTRMLFMLGFGGFSAKKGYHCPIRRRPVIESTDANDLIVSNNATDLYSASRVTHRIMMRAAMLKRMQYVKAYRQIELSTPAPEPNAVDRAKANTEGIQPSQRPEDNDFTIYECYCEWDFGGKDDKAPADLHVPYKVTVEKDSQKVLEVRRHWKEDDPLFLAKRVFVPYWFIPAIGFYGMGLLNILGNATAALTAAWRLALDNAMFANFPGFLYSKQGVGRQKTNEFRVAPGSGMPIETGGMPIGNAVMPLPYRETGPSMFQIMDNISTTSKNVGGIAEIAVGEGKQDAPVGTTLALIEQSTKILSAVHKGLHQSQALEFQMLRELFLEDPESLVKHKSRQSAAWTTPEVMEALANTDLVPAADPNTPSHMHRVMKATGLIQLAQQMPQLFDVPETVNRALKMIGFDDVKALFAKQAPPPPQPSPDKVLEVQARTQQQREQIQANIEKARLKLEGDREKLAAKTADRESREKIELINAEIELWAVIGEYIKNAESNETKEAIAFAKKEESKINSAT